MQSNVFLSLFLISVAFLALHVRTVKGVQHLQHRQERALPLIFPPTAPTRTQWIVGIGIPVEDLKFEAITTGYVFKAEYYLPSTVDHLRIKTPMVIARKSSSSADSSYSSYASASSVSSQSSAKFEQFLVDESELRANKTFWNSKKVLTSYRWTVYKGLEGLANRMGLSGRACVLKSICEAAEVPFHYRNGMFAELLHVLLTPSTSVDELSEHADNEYFQAETLGRSGAECNNVFRNCKKSLIDHFSDVYALTDIMSRVLG